jgi:hypothetical protein
LAERRGILLLYDAVAGGGETAPDGALSGVSGDDVSEVKWFSADQIPWEELAFESTAQFLREWTDNNEIED